MADLPGKEPPGAHLITHEGKMMLAHTHGQKHPVQMVPGVHVHLSKSAHEERRPGASLVHIHKAYHTNPTALSPQLLKAIKEAVANQMQAMEAMESLGGQGAPPPAATAPPAPGLPGSL